MKKNTSKIFKMVVGRLYTGGKRHLWASLIIAILPLAGFGQAGFSHETKLASAHSVINQYNPNQIDSLINTLGDTTAHYIKELSRCNCYPLKYWANMHFLPYVMPCMGCPEPERDPCNCKSLKINLKEVFTDKFSQDDLYAIAKHSNNYMHRLIAVDSYLQSTEGLDGIVALFKTEHLKPNVEPHGSDLPYSEFLDGLLQLIAPSSQHAKPLHDSYLETFIHLQTRFIHHHRTQLIYGWYWSQSPSFSIFKDTMNFGKIDLQYHPRNRKTFELRGEIKVLNFTNKPLIIAPYRAGNIHFEKNSYTIPARGSMEIAFKSTVDLSGGVNAVSRKIKLVNYETKEEQMFTFIAEFIKAGD